MHKLNENIPSAKEFLEKSSIQVRQKKTLASLFLLFQISQGKIEPQRFYSPKELNKKIAENLIKESPVDKSDISVLDEKLQYQKFISSKEFTELLRSFENSKILDHYTGKKTITRMRENIIPEIMGRPDVYKLSHNVVHLQHLLSKPGTIDLVVQSLEHSISNFLKKGFMASIQMLRDWNENDIHTLLKSIKPEEIPNLETFVKQLYPIRERLLSVNHQTMEMVSLPIVDEMVSDILGKSDNFVIRSIILLSLSEL